MRTSTERILTTHVGSLIRPPRLIELTPKAAREGTPRREPDTAEYRAQLATDVEEVVGAQLAAGIDSVNDGEFGKSGWSPYILERISGFEIHPERPKPFDWLGRDRERFRGFFTEQMGEVAFTGGASEVCVGPIAYTDRAPIARDLENLTTAGRRHDVAGHDKELFFTSVAPASTAFQGINEYYASEEEYVFAIADALREEYRAVVDAGVILQVDDAVLANMYDHLVEQGEEVWRRWAQLRVDALNHALEGIDPSRVRYHICFGSWHVPHVADAPLAAIAPFMVQVNAGAYSIEAANPRHEHEWTYWSEHALPDDKVLIPGIVTHHTTTVEHPELVAQRIERFARILGPERVIAGTDCGFAQGATTQRVHPEVLWAKFRSLSEGAAIASGRLYRAAS